jgi:hypothetical protein
MATKNKTAPTTNVKAPDEKKVRKPRRKRQPGEPPTDHKARIVGYAERALSSTKRLAKMLNRAGIESDTASSLADINAALVALLGPDAASFKSKLPDAVHFARQGASRAIVIGSVVRAKPAQSDAYKALGERVVTGFTKLGALLLEGVDESVPADSFIRTEFYNMALSRYGKKKVKSA